MKYNFDEQPSRYNTDSLKWSVGDNELPMWVADMDFQTAPEIRQVLGERLMHGIYGYSVVPEAWYICYMNWWKNRHSFTLNKDWLMFVSGAIPAISSIVRKLTTPAENVVVLTPCYNIFFNCITNNGRNIVESPLLYSNGAYSIDWDDLEQKLALMQTTLMIVCNPHNPIGKIWDVDTLSKIGELCKRYGVTVIADEVHCDITDPGKEYVPFAAASDVCRDVSISIYSPSKAFNMAGLQSACISVPDQFLRHKVNRAINTDEVAEPNCFAVYGAMAAFEYGADWLEELKQYLYVNKQFAQIFIESEVDGVNVVASDATYLLWLDCTAITDDSEALAKQIREKTGLCLSPGAQFGGNGKHFLRLNLACTRAALEEGLARLKAGVAK